MDVAQQFVSELREFGCRFALDDFGSGFGTFDYLKPLEVDYVKLDESLVRDVATSRISQALAHAVITWSTAREWNRSANSTQ